MKVLNVALAAFFAFMVVGARHHGRIPGLGTTLYQQFDDEDLASDELWEKASCKGGKLVELMVGSDAEAGPKIEQTKDRREPSARSEWQGDLKEELKTWGWHGHEVSDDEADLVDSWRVESVVKALGINGKPVSRGGRVTAYNAGHWDPTMKDKQGRPVPAKDQTYKVNGKQYRVTHAHHYFCVNPQDGVIIGQYLESPATAARSLWYRKAAPEELPALRALSDIFWAYWLRDNSNIANIRYFWMMDIANTDTEEIIARALHNVKKSISSWPGVTFTMDTEEGMAILGSANGAVFAWFLIQHKEQLGNKWIPKVTTFVDDRGLMNRGAHLIFYVEAAPEKKKDFGKIDKEPAVDSGAE